MHPDACMHTQTRGHYLLNLHNSSKRSLHHSRRVNSWPCSHSYVNPNLAQETNGYQKSVNQLPSLLLLFRQELIRVHLVATNSTVLQDTWEFSESKRIYRLIGLSIVKYRAVVPNFFLLPHYPNAWLSSAMYPITYKDFQMGPKNTSIPPSTNGHMKNGEEQVQYKKAPPRDLIHLLADTQPHLPGSLTALSLF